MVKVGWLLVANQHIITVSNLHYAQHTQCRVVYQSKPLPLLLGYKENPSKYQPNCCFGWFGFSTTHWSWIEVELCDLALWLKLLNFNVCGNRAPSPRSEPCSSLKRHASFVFLHGHDGMRLGGVLWWGNVAQQAPAEAGFLALGQKQFTRTKRKGGWENIFGMQMWASYETSLP